MAILTILLLLPLQLAMRSALVAETGGGSSERLPPAQEENQALVELRRWMTPFRNERRDVGVLDTDKLRSLLGDLRFHSASPTPLALETLVELACLGWEEHTKDSGPENRRENFALLAMRELGRLLEGQPEVARYLSVEFLTDRPRFEHSAEVLCSVFGRRHIDATAPGLLSVAAGAAPGAMDLAQEALIGWDREDVHRFFLEGLKERQVISSRVGRHFMQVSEKPEWVEVELLELMGARYVSDDWREAVRASHLAHTVDPRRAVPILIEALALWDRRQATGDSSKRVRHEIAEALKAISGRSMGPNVEAWNRWWNAVLEGRIPLAQERLAAGEAPTTATFFGLRPVTDRVAFIIDRSGSMQARFGTGTRSRHLEAMEQAIRFLEKSGVETQFSLTIFSDENRAESWRSKLIKASESNLRSAERWLARKEPDGATFLFPGLAKALRLDRSGRLQAERVGVDTVIVLCDGITDEGPDWVEPWLEQNNEQAQLVFHCVQIGRKGDGTLERLAELTGGQFLRVEG